MCSSMPAFAAFSKHTVAHTRSYLHLRSQSDGHKPLDIEAPRPSEKIPYLAIPPNCYTVSHAERRDKICLGKTSFKNQVHTGELDNVGFDLPEWAAHASGIIQSLEVDVSVSSNPMKGGEGSAGPYGQVSQSSSFPRAACHDDCVGLFNKSYGRDDI